MDKKIQSIIKRVWKNYMEAPMSLRVAVGEILSGSINDKVQDSSNNTMTNSV